MNEKTNAKKRTIVERIKHFEEAITKGREYLETGKHAHLPYSRPLFDDKLKEGKRLPPHKDWVKHVLLPRYERALKNAEKALENITQREHRRQSEPSASIRPAMPK